jgi:Kef-type K+ transport system membrane component KefB
VDHHSFTLLNDIALSIIFAAAAGQLAKLAKLGKSTFTVGIVQFGGCVGVGMLLFHPLGVDGGRFTLLCLAICAALSSTLIVVKLLHDKAEIHSTSGRLTIGVLVLQDLFAIGCPAPRPPSRRAGHAAKRTGRCG